jgi:hypothetical protein
MGGSGLQNEALSTGGYTAGARIACTEEYNGISWSTASPVIVATWYGAGAGLQGETIVFGGYVSGVVACTQEYNKPIVIIDCIK